VRRFGGLFEGACGFLALVAAARRAARATTCGPEVSAFLRDLEIEVLELRRELVTDVYRPGPYHVFTIHDPKTRQITVAPFRDRVVHHALCAQLEPVFERLYIADSYACRRGKGTLRAIQRAQQHSRRNRYFLKLDVQTYFHSIDHNALMDLLRGKLKDGRMLAVLERIVRHPVPGCPAGKGLPIGNLTSQHLANFYLNPLDHQIRERLRPGGYVRYMDDMVLFGDNKQTLWSHADACREFLGAHLRLTLKPRATLLAPVDQGLPFLGRRVFPHLIRLRRENLRRSLDRLRRKHQRLLSGRLNADAWERSLASTFAHLAMADDHADTRALRRRVAQCFCQESNASQAGPALGTGFHGPGPEAGSNRVIRGGSWNNNAQNCRSANRNNNSPGNSNNNIGFRLASSRHCPTARVHGRGLSAPGHDQAHGPVPPLARGTADEEAATRGGW